MCDYFYNAFGELTKGKPNLNTNVNLCNNCVEKFDTLTIPPPEKQYKVEHTDTCGSIFPLKIDGVCGRDISICMSGRDEKLSSDKQYCLRNNTIDITTPCGGLYPTAVDSTCGRPINMCLDKETMSENNKYCLKR